MFREYFKFGLRRSMSLVVLLSFTVAVNAASAQDADEGLDYDALASAVDELEQRLERVREAIDQTRFEPDEVVFTLNFDAEEIVGFVRDDIAFHPYEGLLRGMRGTLMSKAGNSLDQSLLLAYLLKSAGLDARIVRGELDDVQIGSLLAQTARPTEDEDLSSLNAALEENFGEDALQPNPADDWDKAALQKSSRDTIALLERELASAGVKLDASTINQKLRAQLKSYFWVEHRGAPGDDWQVAHPAFADGSEPKVEPMEYMADEIDQRFHHTVTVEAWIRQRQGNEFENHRLMKPWERPAANLHGVTISYRNHPGSITPETLSNLEEALDEDEILSPVFRNAPAPGAMAFNLKGQIIDPMALGSGSFGAAGLFAELSDKMQTATETIEDREDGRPVFALDSMWLEFTLTTPSGSETRYRRYLLAPGAHADSLSEKLWPLLSEYVYVINTGSMPLDYVADRYLAAGSESMGIYKALAHKLLRPGQGTPLPDADVPKDFGPLALYRLMNDNSPSGDAVAVRHVPAVIGLRNGLRNVETAFSAVDIIENRMLQIQVSDEGVAHDPAQALARGVWETAIETLSGQLRNSSRASLNAFEVFKSAREQDIGLRVIRTGDAFPDSLSSGEAAVLKHDLDNGYAVLLPERKPEDVAMTAWWRVDPVTGTALGMTADGYGQDAVEYMIQITSISFNLIQAIGGLAKCQEEPEDVLKMCCLVEAHMNNVASLGFGGYLGATMGTAGAALFDVVNYGVQQATGESLSPTFDMQCDQYAGSGF